MSDSWYMEYHHVNPVTKERSAPCIMKHWGIVAVLKEGKRTGSVVQWADITHDRDGQIDAAHLVTRVFNGGAAIIDEMLCYP